MTAHTTGAGAGQGGAVGDDPLDVDGPAAPPRANGELVFTAPWQSRLFATTMRLHETGRIRWEDFRRGLIDEIARHEATLDDPDRYDYWGCWQRALEALLAASAIVDAGELETTSATLAARPPGHDHSHGDHDHSPPPPRPRPQPRRSRRARPRALSRVGVAADPGGRWGHPGGPGLRPRRPGAGRPAAPRPRLRPDRR